MESIPASGILTRKKDTSWFGTEYNMNLYRGCPHGCIYCDSRSDCYHIEDFDRVRVKENALEILQGELRSKTKTGVIATGSMSDPYNPFERNLQLMRGALELTHRYGFGIAVATKGALVARDADLFAGIQKHSPVIIKITVTTSDDGLARKLEPGAPPPSKRFEALGQLSEKGIYAGLLLMPVLPFLEDSTENIRDIIRLAAENGARFLYPMFGLTLRQGQREWFYSRLNEQFPGEGLSERYRGQFGLDYVCLSPQVSQLKALFEEECERYGLLWQMKEIIASYREGYGDGQLSLF